MTEEGSRQPSGVTNINCISSINDEVDADDRSFQRQRAASVFGPFQREIHEPGNAFPSAVNEEVAL